jgi:hypothetical protein
VSLAPTPTLHRQAYPQTAGGRFVALADFEDAPGARTGSAQVRHFALAPAGGGQRQFAVNITRTGAGALSADLPPESQLVFVLPEVRDFADFTLLSLAMHVDAPRDDLRVLLVGPEGVWASPRKLLRAGWNTVEVDLGRLVGEGRIDLGDVREIRLAMTRAGGDVRLYLDDILLIDNRRQIEPVPEGIRLRARGLDYELHLPHWPEPVHIRQGADGLWRMGKHQTRLALAGGAPSQGLGYESLEPLGDRRIGELEVIEANAVRLRIANRWFFPRRAGEWASMAVRHVTWEHTFYSDGRWITSVEINNAGGQPIEAIRWVHDQRVAWSDGPVVRSREVRPFAGPLGRWSFLRLPPTARGGQGYASYLSEGKIRAPQSHLAGGVKGRFAADEGCYRVAADAPRCRFRIEPPAGGLINPVFRVHGAFAGGVSVNSEGLAVRRRVQLADGSVLFMMPGLVDRPATVEVSR